MAPQSTNSLPPHLWDQKKACIFLGSNTEMLCQDTSSHFCPSTGSSWAAGSYMRLSHYNLGTNHLRFVENCFSLMAAFGGDPRIPLRCCLSCEIVCFGEPYFIYSSFKTELLESRVTAEQKAFFKDF